MAEQTTVNRICDVCTDTEPATARWRGYLHRPERRGVRPEPRIIDTCDMHSQLFTAAAASLRNHGAVEPAAAAVQRDRAAAAAGATGFAGRTETCPECGVIYHRGGIGHHLRNVHKVKWPTIPKRCPDCGFRGARQAMQNHLRTHGASPLDRVLAELRAR